MSESVSKPPTLKLESVPGGPAPDTPLCTLAEIPDGGAHKLEFRDGEQRFEMFICRDDKLGHGEQIFAYENSCPHAGLPLDYRPGKFLNYEKTHLSCANHGAMFKIDDGFCVKGPCRGQYLRPIDIYVKDGTVFAR